MRVAFELLDRPCPENSALRNITPCVASTPTTRPA